MKLHCFDKIQGRYQSDRSYQTRMSAYAYPFRSRLSSTQCSPHPTLSPVVRLLSGRAFRTSRSPQVEARASGIEARYNLPLPYPLPQGEREKLNSGGH
jgi:hypothetical protein